MADPTIKITLERVECHETEDHFGSDEFYVISAFAHKKGAKPIPKITRIWDMNNGEVIKPNLVLFNETVDSDEESYFVITCWDKDAAEDITQEDLEKASNMTAQLFDEVKENIHLKNSDFTEVSNWIIKAIEGLFYIIGLLVNLDKDDFLGRDDRHIPTPTKLQDYFGFLVGDWSQTYNFKCREDGCHYDVYYKVDVTT